MIRLLMNWFYGVFPSDARRSMPKSTNDHDDGPIYKFHDPPNPNAVIIFFHDVRLGAQDEQLPQSSWMSSSDPPVCWPETWLSDKYPDAQILSACYDSGIQKKITTGHMDLYKLGENLRQDILPIYTVGCPIFMVGHGLGGLVIMALIKEIQEKRDRLARVVDVNKEPGNNKERHKLDSFLKNVKGILYYATPFLGSKPVDSMNHLPDRGSLMDPIEVLSTEASRLSYWFSQWQKHRICNTKMVLAGRPTEVGLWYGHLVEEAAARHDIDDFYTSDSDHFNVCKPRNNSDDIRFTFLTKLIDPVMAALPPKTDPPIEDSDKSACAEYVETVLNHLEKLEQGVGLVLQTHHLAKLRKFEDLSGSLNEGLKAAGLEHTGYDGDIEHWEPVHYFDKHTTDFVNTEQSNDVSDGVPENFPPQLPEGHSPSDLDGIVGRGVPDQRDVEESTTTFTTSDATSIPTNTKVDCETRSLVETPQSSVRDGKESKLLEVFLTEVNNSGGDGYFLSKKWLLTLDEHEREELFFVLGRNGYLEIYGTLTTVFYERTEEHVQVLSMYDDPSRAHENNDLCFGDENEVEPLDDGVTSSKIEQTRFSAAKRDGDLFNSSKSTLSLDNKTQSLTGEISPSDAPSSLLEKGEMPLTYFTDMLKSLKTAVKNSSLYNYAVSTHWLSTLNDHQLEDLNSALSEAGYSEIYKTSTTTYFERIQGRIKTCPTYETDTVGTSGRNDIGGDKESTGSFQGHGNSLADNHGSDVGGGDSLAVSEGSSETFTKCKCPPQCLTVSVFDLNFMPPSQSTIELSTSSSQGAYVFNTSSRQQVGNCSVTFPKDRGAYVISTEVDKDISMTTVEFATADGCVPSEENVSVNVSAGTSLTCCLRSDHDNKVYIKFSTIKGEAKLGEAVDLEEALALGSVRVNVHACLVDSERVGDFEEISLSMEEEYTRRPWTRMLKGGVWLAPSATRLPHSQFQSRTVELQCEVKKRAAADRRDCRREARCLSFEGSPPVVMEGKIIGDLKKNSFLQLQIRYQVEIMSFPKPFFTPLPAGTSFVRTFRRVLQVENFDCVVVMRTQNLYSEGSYN